MSIIDEAKAAGIPVWDGKTPQKCYACDFVTANLHDMMTHMVEHHPMPSGDVGALCTPDPVLQQTINRCIRAMFTGNHADGMAAIMEHAKARRKN